MFKFEELKPYTQSINYNGDLYRVSSNCVSIKESTISSMNLLEEIDFLKEIYLGKISKYDFLLFFQEEKSLVGEDAIFRRFTNDGIIVLECIYCKDITKLLNYIKTCIEYEIKICNYKNYERLNISRKQIFIYVPPIITIDLNKSIVKTFDVLEEDLLTELQEYIYEIYVDSEFKPLMI